MRAAASCCSSFAVSDLAWVALAFGMCTVRMMLHGAPTSRVSVPGMGTLLFFQRSRSYSSSANFLSVLVA